MTVGTHTMNYQDNVQCIICDSMFDEFITNSNGVCYYCKYKESSEQICEFR